MPNQNKHEADASRKTSTKKTSAKQTSRKKPSTKKPSVNAPATKKQAPHPLRSRDLRRAKSATAAEVAELRRVSASADLLAFMRVYLPETARLPFCRMHEEIAAELDGSLEHRGIRYAVAAPRGHAKSTLVSKAHVLRAAVTGKERFIVLISETADQAVGHLASIKTELERNDKLRADYADACIHPGPDRWKANDIVLGNSVRIMALGSGQNIRGVKAGDERPTLIVLDDIESRQSVRSADSREDTWRWMHSDVIKAGSATTNVVVIGTTLHPDSVLSRLLSPEQPAWTSQRYSAIEAWGEDTEYWEDWECLVRGTMNYQGRTGPSMAMAYYNDCREQMDKGVKVLWPERANYVDLMMERLTGGKDIFSCEMLNEPVDASQRVFSESELLFWDDPKNPEFTSVEQMRQEFGAYRHSIVASCDPSMGVEGAHGDNSALVILVYNHKSKVYYVVDVVMEKCKPDRLLNLIMDKHRVWGMRSLGFESVAFQGVLADQLIARARDARPIMTVEKTKPRGSKFDRIRSLDVLIGSGKLRFSVRHRKLIEQLTGFPSARHDDGPDALEIAVNVAAKPVFRILTNGRGAL